MHEDSPTLQQGDLDEAQLERLFVALAACADAPEVLVKDGPRTKTRAGAEPVTLAEARKMLDSREVFAVQIRYAHAGRFWCDTLFPRSTGVRLIRTEVTDGGTPGT